MFFQLVICSVLLAEAFGSLAAGGIMAASGPVTSLWVGCIFASAGLLLAVILPETLYMRRTRPLDRQELHQSWREQKSLHGFFRDTLESINTSRRYLTQKRGMLRLVVPGALSFPLATTSISILAQSLPSRYGMDYSAFLGVNLIRALETVAVFVIVVPLIYLFWPWPNFFERDVCLVKVFAFFLAFSMFIIAAVPSFEGALAGVVIFTIGSPVPGLARSVLSQMVRKQHLGGFFGLLALIEQLGFLLLNLVMSLVYQASLEHGGGAWLGLPFYFAGTLFVLMWLGVMTAVPKKLPEEDDDAELRELDSGQHRMI